MLEKTSISSYLQVKKYTNPPNQKLEDFPFGLVAKVYAKDIVFDLVNGPQIFDVSSVRITLQNDVLKEIRPIRLEQCTK